MAEFSITEFYKKYPTIPHERCIFMFDDFWKQEWIKKDVTVIFCQRKTKSFTQITLESLLRFYPDIPIVVSEDDSLDDSAQYLQYKELVTPNLKVWMRKEGYHGHGLQLDEIITQFVRTKYCLLIDSDIVVERGGFVELMIAEFEKDENLYALGTLHYGSYENNGNDPRSEEDAVPYAHPQCSMIRADKYLQMQYPFITDGAPLILNMKEAKDKKMRVDIFPTDKYISHRGGSSYLVPHSVWDDSHNVYLRPFVTFILRNNQSFNSDSTDTDFDVVFATNNNTSIDVVTSNNELHKVNNNLYKIRFNLNGEYIIDCRSCDAVFLGSNFINAFKTAAIEYKAPNEFVFDGLVATKRNIFQKVNCLQ
jgi:hypothetical protein